MDLLDIPCRITYYPDFDEKFNRTKDDMILEDLICTNIMQRGVGNVNPMKMAKCIMELERIYGIRKGSSNEKGTIIGHQDNLYDGKTQSELANQLKISQQQLGDYKKLTNLIPELQLMVENGSMKATVGYKIWAKMSQEEQEKFFEEIGREKIKTMTQKATEKYIEENNKLIKELEEEKNKPKEKEYIETVIDKTDYSSIDNLEIEKKSLQLKIIELQDRMSKQKVEYADNPKLSNELEMAEKQLEDLNKKLSTQTIQNYQMN